MLSNDERDELLVRIDERVHELRRDMKHAKDDKGFARCLVHKAQVDGLQKSFTWGRRTVLGGLIALVINFIYEQITL